jgi:hypothetical protein
MTTFWEWTRECTEKQRRDAENVVFPLCMLGCDALYEQGFVSVNCEGKVVATARPSLPVKLKRRLEQIDGRRCDAWTKTNKDYFAWHYERRFR